MSATIFFMKLQTKAGANTITSLFFANDGRDTTGFTTITEAQYDTIPKDLKDPEDDTSATWNYKWATDHHEAK